MTTRFECIESTIDVQTLIYDVRVWVAEDEEIKQAIMYKDYLDELVEHIKYLGNQELSMRDLIVAIAEKPRINAIQVRNKTSDYCRGLMVYLTPFESDIMRKRVEDLEDAVCNSTKI